VVVLEETKEILGIRKILEYLYEKKVNPTPILVDNTFAIELAKNPIFHDKIKNIKKVTYNSISCRGQNYSLETLFHK
jgi:hypothetical protein